MCQGRLPLHLALEVGCSHDTIRILVRRSAASAATVRDFEFKLPLHHAIRACATLAAVRSVIDANPQAVLEDGGVVIATAAAAAPEAATSSQLETNSSRRGRRGGQEVASPPSAKTPMLHAAIRCGAPDEVVLEIYRRCATLRSAASKNEMRSKAHDQAARAASGVLAKRTSCLGRAAASAGTATGVTATGGHGESSALSDARAAAAEAEAVKAAAQEAAAAKRAVSVGAAAASLFTSATDSILLDRDAPEGRMALHVALEAGRSEKVVRTLLAAEPGVAREVEWKTGALPLHLALAHGATEGTCMALFDAFRDGVFATDGEGRLPLAIALEHGAPRPVTWALMMAFPDAAKARSKAGLLTASAGVRVKSKDEERFDAVEERVRLHRVSVKRDAELRAEQRRAQDRAARGSWDSDEFQG